MAKDDFYIVNSWMIEELGLSGIELQCFAIIWSLSRGEKQMYIAGNSHLIKMTKKTEHTIISALKKLCEKGYIKKIPVVLNNVERNYYKAINQGCKNFSGGTAKISVGGTAKISVPNIESNNIESNNKENRLSNDNQKAEYSDDFLEFWKLYNYPRGKKTAYTRWRNLSKKDREAAIAAVPAYLEDCVRNFRAIQYPATYLNKRTFEDDFSSKGKLRIYDPLDTDSDEKKRFKAWMRATHPEIENTALPLSYEDYMELVKDEEYGGVDVVESALVAIENEIWKYRKTDIRYVIRRMIENGCQL